MRFIAFFLTALAAFSQTALHLRDGKRFTITDWDGNSKPASLTVDDASALAPGTEIYIHGVQTNVLVNGNRIVKTRVGNTITITDRSGKDIQAYPGAKIDSDHLTPGFQLGYVGRTRSVTLNPHPRSIWPADPALRVDLFGPGGPGSGTSRLKTYDREAYDYIMAKANSAAYVTPGCDGNSDSRCSGEFTRFRTNDAAIQQGDIPIIIALAWAVTDNAGDRGRYLNSVRYYINRFHYIGKTFKSFSSADEVAAGVGMSSGGMSADYISFFVSNWTDAASLIWSALSPAERQMFAKKVWNGMDGSACDNTMDPLGGEANGTAGKNHFVTNDSRAAELKKDTPIYLKELWQRFKISDGSMVNVVVSGTGASKAIVINLNQEIQVSNDSTVQISDSKIPGLDRNWQTSSNGKVRSLSLRAPNATIENGTYTTPTMSAYKFHTYDTIGDTFNVVSVSGSGPWTVTVSGLLTYKAINSPWATIREWHPNACGLMFRNGSHGNSPGMNNDHRKVLLKSAYGLTDTVIKLDPTRLNNLRDKTPPFYLENPQRLEVMKVTAIDWTNSTATVERGAKGTPPNPSVNAVAALEYRRFPRGFKNEGADYRVMLSEPSDNLAVTRAYSNIVISFNLLEELGSSGIDFAEQAWNWWYDVEYPRQKAMWTGQTPGGGNGGYHGGRYGDWTASVTAVGLNSFTPAIDMRGVHTQQMSAWWPYITVPYADFNPSSPVPYAMVFADSGSSYALDGDDIKIGWFNNYLHAGTPEQKWLHHYLTSVSNWRLDPETIRWRVAYTRPSTPGEDYRQHAPRFKVFNQTTDRGGKPAQSAYNVMSGRASWSKSDSPSSIWCLLLSFPTDHLGTYYPMGTCSLWQGNDAAPNRVKGSPLITANSPAGLAGNNAYLSEGVTFEKLMTDISLGAASHVTATATAIVSDVQPVDTVYELSSNNETISVPKWLVIPAGKRSKPFQLLAYNPAPQGGYGVATITATGANTIASMTQVAGKYECAAGPACNGTGSANIVSITSDAGSVRSGEPITATLTLASPAPAGGAHVKLSVNSSKMAVPTTLRVRTGQTKIDFYISTAPATSDQTATVSATAGNTVTLNVTATALAAMPKAGKLAIIRTTKPENGGGYVSLPRVEVKAAKEGSDFLYAMTFGRSVDAEHPSEAYGAASRVGSYFRRILYWSPKVNSTYLVTYDVINSSSAGAQKIWMIPYYRGSGDSSSETIPPNTMPTRNGTDITFIKPFNQTSVRTRILRPANAAIWDDFDVVGTASAPKWAAQVWINGGQTAGETEFMAVHKPHAGLSEPFPDTHLLPNVSGNFHGVYIPDAACPLTALFLKQPDPSNPNSATELKYTTPTYSGKCPQLGTGLAAGIYDIRLDDSLIAKHQPVGEDGTLRFDSASGNVAIYRIGKVFSDPPTETLSLSVRANGAVALATIHATSLNPQEDCTVTVRDLTNQIVATETSKAGPSTRTVEIPGLTGGASYSAQAACGSKIGSAHFTSEPVTGIKVIQHRSHSVRRADKSSHSFSGSRAETSAGSDRDPLAFSDQ